MRRAQSSLEYALVIAAVAGALIAMSAYIQRSAQGRLRQAADEFGQQYAPGQTDSDITLEMSGRVVTEVTTNVTAEGRLATTTNTIIESESEHRHGTENIVP